MSGHTPGPWWQDDVSHHADGSFDIRAMVSGVDYPCVVASRSQWPARIEESRANGALIAAAPELLEEVDEVIARWSGFLEANDPTLLAHLKQAAAKARGEP